MDGSHTFEFRQGISKKLSQQKMFGADDSPRKLRHTYPHALDISCQDAETIQHVQRFQVVARKLLEYNILVGISILILCTHSTKVDR